MRSIALLVLPLALVLAGCPSHTRMPEAEQALAREQHTHRTRRLAVSMYTGPFFRDARYKLLSDQPPESLDLMRDPAGERMLPGPAEGILPAGTEVHISEVEFPTAVVTTGRSLLTPRFFTWVYVEVPGHDKLHVLVVRDDPATGTGFRELLSRWLTEDDPRPTLAAWPETVRQAVAEKRLLEGMEEAAVRMAWGHPLELRQRFEGGERIQEWVYEGGRIATLVAGKLTTFSEPK